MRPLVACLLILGAGALVEAQEQSLFEKQTQLFLNYQQALEGCQGAPGKISKSDMDCVERASNSLDDALDRLKKNSKRTATEQLLLDGYSSLGQVYAVNFVGCGMPGSILLEGRRVFLCDPDDPASLYGPRGSQNSKIPMLLLQQPRSNAPAILVNGILIRGKAVVQ